MSTFNNCRRLLCLLTILPLQLQAHSPGPGLGQPIVENGQASAILIDGTGLHAGRGDVASGEVLFNQHCMSCHGIEGQGGSNDRLTGGHGSLTTTAPVKTIGSYWPYATTLFDYIGRAMPYNSPGVLSADEVYSITAYLLYLNGILSLDASIDRHSLPKVMMPNRNGFDTAHPL